MSTINSHPDALGNEIIVGNLYGYSRNDGGFSHVTIGQAVGAKNGKVRLTGCAVTRFLYGEPTDHRLGERPGDVSIRSSMVFPVAGTVK